MTFQTWCSRLFPISKSLCSREPSEFNTVKTYFFILNIQLYIPDNGGNLMPIFLNLKQQHTGVNDGISFVPFLQSQVSKLPSQFA